MDKAKFKRQLEEATAITAKSTRQYCFNEISERYLYRITPNVRSSDVHLSTEEKSILKLWNKYEDKELETDKIVELLNFDNKVPLWINISIYEADSDVTKIDLTCSRRLREDEELYHKGEVMPFHVLIPIPPNFSGKESDGKFDINWRKVAKKKTSFRNILNQLFRRQNKG